MKILFLDIDGVVCTLRSQFAYGERLLMESWDITCCQMIRRLCAANGYQIVCSSTWRKHERTRMYFAVYGLVDYLHEDWRTPLKVDYEQEQRRGTEIQAWLDNHKDTEAYIILDDDSDMLDHQKEFFVCTDSREGFGSRHFEKADEIMGGKFHEYVFKRKNRDRRMFNFDEVVG